MSRRRQHKRYKKQNKNSSLHFASLSLSLSLARARTMPPNRLPLPVRPDVYPLLGALALATAGALSFSFLTLRKAFEERSELQEAGKREEAGPR